MIKVTTMDKREIAVNSDLIERIESIPETMISLNNGKKIIVLNSMDEVLEKITVYKKEVFSSKF